MKKVIIIVFLFISIFICNKALAYEVYEIGDKVTYRNETYYVVENSDSNSNYIKLLKEKPFSVKELYRYGKDEKDKMVVNKYVNFYTDLEKVFFEYDNDIGGMVYYSYYGCFFNYTPLTNVFISKEESSSCNNAFDKSDIKKVLDNWIKPFQGDLIEVNNNKATILSIDDMVNNFGFNLDENITDKIIYKSSLVPVWLFDANYNYWISNTNNQIDKQFSFNVMQNGEITLNKVYDHGAVRPVIYLNKCALDDDDCYDCSVVKKITKYKEYLLYDEIIYKGEKYYVISNSGGEKSYVTLLKDEPLSIDDIKKYNQNHVYDDGIGQIKYYTSDTCFLRDSSGYTFQGCSYEYSTSKVKKVIDKWGELELRDDDLVSVDGYKYRILTKEEYNSLLINENTRNVVETQYEYWITNLDDWDIVKYRAVRPVINVKKDLFNHNDLQIGNTVIYMNSEYYIIDYADTNGGYVVLLKKQPLTNNQILQYYNDYGVMPYYKSNECNSYENRSGCTTNFDTSLVKITLDNWANDKNMMTDLVSIDNYKIRLLTRDELLNNLGYSFRNNITRYSFGLTENVPKWMYSERFSYWTMSSEDEINDSVYVILNSGNVDLNADYFIYNNNKRIFNLNSVRPVINLNKCVLEDGCYEVEKKIEVDCKNSSIENENVKKENTVEIENTLKLVSKVLLCVSVVLIIGGFVIIFYNYYLVKKK